MIESIDLLVSLPCCSLTCLSTTLNSSLGQIIIVHSHISYTPFLTIKSLKLWKKPTTKANDPTDITYYIVSHVLVYMQLTAVKETVFLLAKSLLFIVTTNLV